MTKVQQKKIYMRESVFGELFYKILLRLNFSDFTLPIFKCFEASFWFLNVHLKNVELSFLGRVTILEGKRVIGSEALIHIHIYSKIPNVKSQAKKMVFDIVKAELDSGKQLQKVAFEDIIMPCRELIDKEYEELASSLDRIAAITDAFSLIKDVIVLIGGSSESACSDMFQGIGGAPGPYEPVDGKSLIKIVIENNTPVTKYKNLEMEISEYATLRELKKQVLDLFVCFTSSDVFMMSKGRILYELDKSLKELSIGNAQKVLLFQNEDYERDTETEMMKAKSSKIDQVREILPDFPRDLVSLALTRNGDDVPLTIAYLSEGSGVLLEEELKIIEKRKLEIGKNGAQGGGNPQKRAEVKALLSTLASYSEFYDLIFKFMRLNNDNLNKILWVLLLAMPLSAQTKQEIIGQMEKNGMGMDIEFAQPQSSSSFDIAAILSNPLSSQSCYKLYVLSKVLSENFSNSALEWLLFEGNLLLLATSLETSEIKSLEEGVQMKPQQRSAVLRYLGAVMNIMKFLNAKFANPPSLRTKLLTGQPIYAQLLKECEAEDQGTQSVKDDYFEMYAQTVQESGFDDRVYRLLNSFLADSKPLEGDELSLVMNMFQFCLEFGEKRKTIEILNMLTEKICSGSQAGDSQATLINIALYYGCLLGLERDLMESLMAHMPEVDRFEGLPNLVAVMDSLKSRIELIGQFTSLKERKKNRSKDRWNEVTNLLKSYLSKLRNLFKNLIEKGRINREMWESYGRCDNLEFPDTQVEYFNKMKLISNELFLLFSQITKFLASILPFLSQDADLSEFYENFALAVLKEILTDQHSYVSTLSLQQDSRIRTYLFDIILLFVSSDPNRSLDLLIQLSSFYKDDDFKANQWNYVDVRKPGSYIGIKNLGSTCYANSLLQQMYHNKRIREFLLSIKTPEQGVLHELQKVFEELNAGMLSQADLLKFTKVFKGFEGMPINVKVQQDVNEFFNLLLDTIESELKEAKFEGYDVFKEELGGMFHNEIESLEKDFPYTTKNEEHYNTLSLDVKGTGSIQEAIDKYFKTEVFEGDNKLYCEKYDSKIRVKKKTWLSQHMPETLLVMLKRFEYDGQTFTRHKLNDFFEFPLELNLGKWVNLPADEGLSLIDEPSKFTYRLKGVIVHSGTSEFGHYYSFIRIGEKWIEFNDTKVSEFNLTPENLKKEWFGADSDGGMFPFTSTSKSAYMLFYEKIGQPISPLKSKLDEEKPVQVDSKAYEELSMTNESFLRVKAYNDLGMIRFMNELLGKLDSEEGLNKLTELLIERTVLPIEKPGPQAMDQEITKEPASDVILEPQDKQNKETPKIEIEVLQEKNSSPTHADESQPVKLEDRSFEIMSDQAFIDAPEQDIVTEAKKSPYSDKLKLGLGEQLFSFLKNLKVAKTYPRASCWISCRTEARP